MICSIRSLEVSNRMPNKQKRTLRPFQREVLRVLQEEKKSVILQAPTGAGKTDAALLPYVQCLLLDNAG
jgi:Lhr-like helicase